MKKLESRKNQIILGLLYQAIMSLQLRIKFARILKFILISLHIIYQNIRLIK